MAPFRLHRSPKRVLPASPCVPLPGLRPGRVPLPGRTSDEQPAIACVADARDPAFWPPVRARVWRRVAVVLAVAIAAGLAGFLDGAERGLLLLYERRELAPPLGIS